jgi:hypothetical protein
LHAAGPPPSAYKNTLRARHRTHTIPSNLPDNLSLLSSLWLAIAVDTGELLDAGGATASGRRWRNERREVDEKSLRNLFCYTITKLSFLYAAPIATLFSVAPSVSSARDEEDE